MVFPGIPIDPVTGYKIGEKIANSRIEADANKIIAEKRQKAADQLRIIKNADPNNPQDVLAAQFAAFGASKGVFEPAIGEGYTTSGEKVDEALRLQSRRNIPPASLSPWECRIGLTKLMVPPLNINVLNQYRTGSLSGGVLRQTTPPKYNSGHSETRISMTLYFPNHESIWGYEGDRFEINFDQDDEKVIDGFLSSLRGLITQFKYAPFLPIRNAYLNQVYDITAVALESMTVSTVQGFPFCVAVQLNMLHFNHEVYLPMIEDFNNAIHWGRFRQHLGRAASRMNQAAGKNFLTMDSKERIALDRPSTYDESLIDGRILSSQFQGNEIDRVSSFSKTYDWLDGKDFDMYYVDHDPAKVVGPDLSDFRSSVEQETIDSPSANKRWWQQLLSLVGFDVNTHPTAAFDIASQYSDLSGRSQQSMMDFALSREYNLLTQWLKSVNLIATNMGQGQLDEYISQRAKDYGRTLTDAEYKELTHRIEAAWFAAMYLMYLRDPYLQNVLSYQARRRGWYAIKEWEVPMRKLGLNPDKVIVNGVSVSMGNNIKSLQVQLQDKPVYQHLGGLETRCEISLTIFGEDNLLAIRRALETVSGLSRLEHGHAVLGFLGIKNVLTALCGMKYALPIAWEANTVPGFPHVYNCRLTLTDFDVFQQKREILSSEQQAELIEAFSKRNPLLRIRQQWSAFNAYPDMPLDVRDEQGKIIGHYEPDYYFRSFKSLDDDVVNWKSYYSTKDANNKTDPNKVNKETFTGSGIEYTFGSYDESKKAQKIRVHPDGMDIIDGTETLYKDLEWFEPTLANSVVGPYVDGLTPPSETTHPYYDKSNNLTNQFQKLTNDMQYRDKAGRMIRAFPTFMLWIIDEGGTLWGYKLNDNFYGLQSVIDMSIMSSEDLLGDTLTIRLSNLYGRLSTPFRELIDEELYTSAKIINRQLNRNRNLASGLSDYLVTLETIDLKPGVRVHLRMGYSANPNALDVVFNGTITQVQQGDVVTIIAQSDAIELGAIVNNSDKDSNSGSLDGAMLSGLWTSEPRDLMCRLLSMGSSTFKESLAHASKGAIFSENRYGIRHFGTILYAPMTLEEEARQNARTDKMIRNLKKGAENFGKGGIIGSIVGFFNFGMFDLISNAWNNFMRKRDYELYKRNIYPGNGLGIGQYLGGDFGDGGFNNGFSATGLNENGELVDPATGESLEINNQDPRVLLNTSRKIVKESISNNADSGKNSFWSMNNPFLQAMGITRPGGADDDVSVGGGIDSNQAIAGGISAGFGALIGMPLGPIGMLGGAALFGAFGSSAAEELSQGPFDEISFRAQTYMKSIWDIFKVCAALLPNYIVAVRPFEHRSTVFYGKPHWLYTSGVIPLSKGIGKQNFPETDPPEKEELSKILKSVEKRYKNRETTSEFYARLIGQATEVGLGDPYSSANGVTWEGENVAQLPLMHMSLGIQIPIRKGQGVRGLHLPTSASIDVDIDQHEQISALLPQAWRHPYYMDRESSNDSKDFMDVLLKRAAGKDQGKSDIAKEENATVTGEKSSLPGRKPDSEKYPDPEMETYYVAMNWDYSKGGKANYYNNTARVLVYNVQTKKGVICSIQDKVNPRSKGFTDDNPNDDALNKSNHNDSPNSIFIRPINALLNSSDIVVSPEAWQLMDSIPGHEYMVGFVSDKYALGPIVYDSSGQFNVGGPISKLEQKNEPKSVSGLPKWMSSSTNKLETTSDPRKFALKFGSTNPNIPVDFTDMDSGLRDYIGKLAAEVYSNNGEYGEGRVGWDGRTKKEAEEIWDEFRERYKTGGSKYMVAIFNKAYPELAIREDYDGTAIKNLPDTVPDFAKDKVQDFINNHPNKVAKTTDNENKYQLVLKSFYDFMWQNPYNRGWLVKTADRGLDPGIILPIVPGLPIDTEDLRMLEDVPYLGDVARGVADFGKKAGDIIDTGVAAVGGLFGIGGGADEANKWNWDFDRAHGAFAVYITNGPQAATSWIISHSNPGEEQQGISGKITEEFVTKVFNPIYDYLKSFVTGLANVFSSIIALIRVNLMSMTYGLGMSNYMQRQANQLNRAFNDSIYFNPKYKFNSLLYLADNPFTREFGEPVVEIRQPFQRVHHINSFDHILNNGIQQNTQNVATVITATSRSKNPVTVWFDKGSPVESQKEKVVETGLWFDAPKGLLGNLIHPIRATRNFFNVMNAQPDELLAKRVALWHLRKNLQDIYSGEILILGDPSIRPFDLVYMADSYERIYGLFEVEKVVHHFTSETGFITSITPNAVVTINDPMRWSAFAALKTSMAIGATRDNLRRALGVRNGKAIYGLPPRADAKKIANTLESQILGHIDYTGGASALIKDFADTAGKGMLISTAIAPLVPGAPIIAGLGILGAWKAAKWVTENLIDQQGCYIQYLTKAGNPMDAGLSYNSGVAVGRMHISTLFSNSLRLPISVIKDGHSRIATNDLLEKLGWQEYEVEELIKDVDLWNNEVNKNILLLSNRSPDGIPFKKVNAKIVTVTNAIDGANFEVAEKDFAPNGVRLAGIVAPIPRVTPTVFFDDPGTKAKLHLKEKLIDIPYYLGFRSTVALRVDPNTPKDKFGRVVAWVFHNVPSGKVEAGDSNAREALLLKQAESWPQIEWDSFLPEGLPYTFNWSSVLAGFTNIDRSIFSVTIPGEGVDGGI